MGVKQFFWFQTLKDHYLCLLHEKKFHVQLWGIFIITFMFDFSLVFLRMGNI